MVIKIVDESERKGLVRENIKHAAEIVKAMQLVLSDDTKELDEHKALLELSEAIDFLTLAYQDTYDDDEGTNELELDVIRLVDRKFLSTESIDDSF